MGLRFLLLVIAIWIILLILRFYLNQSRKERGSTNRIQIDTVRCQQCDLAMPKKGAIRIGEHFFCSEEHASSYHDD